MRLKYKKDLPESVVQRLAELRRSGVSMPGIAAKTGLHYSQVYFQMKRCGLLEKPTVVERDKIIDKVAELREAGKSVGDIARAINKSPSHAKYLVQKVLTRKTEIAQCMDCGKSFTRMANQQKPRNFCSRNCSYRYRVRLETEAQPSVKCINPGCNVLFKKSKIKRHQYCSVKCAREDAKRWYVSPDLAAAGHGFYKKIFTKTPSCLACGEWRTVQEHHTIFTGGKSDKSSPTVFLCPTHHVLIHCGFARIENGDYIETDVEFFKREVSLKQADKLQAVQPVWKRNATNIFCWGRKFYPWLK